jgi:hypothetical protein
MERSTKRNTEEQQGDNVNPPAKKTKVEEQPADVKLCASCSQVKSRDLFSKKQWKGQGDKKRRCVACTASELGIAAPTAASLEAAEKKKAANREAAEKRKALELERQLERDKLRAQQQQMADLKEQEWLEGNGPQIQMPTFEVPGDGTSWASDEETPEVTFKNMPTLASLVGSYDLIFYYNAGDEEGIPKNRATKGSLDFTIDATGELHGIVALHKSVKNASWDHRYDAKITCKSDEEQEQDKAVGAFEVTNIEELENLCYEDVQGTIQRVATRQAVRYMPECEDDDVEDYQLDYGESIQFGNAQEAQLILDKYHQEPFLWLCSHKNLANEVSSLIRRFASKKPPPIFFFEEDDLFLTFKWDDSCRDAYKTVLVARRQI